MESHSCQRAQGTFNQSGDWSSQIDYHEDEETAIYGSAWRGLRVLEQLDEKDCKDGHCAEFSQIPEAQLLAHLTDGWEIVKELSNCEVIVKRIC